MTCSRKLALFLVLLSFHWDGHYVLGSRLSFVATPTAIQPMITNTLKLRCAVVLDNALQARQLHGNLDFGQTGEPVTIADIDHIMSIILSRYNPTTNTNDEIANVTPYDQPVAGKSYANLVQTEGNTDYSPVSGEKGYLEVTMFKPVDGGTYKCDVTALTTDRHPASLSQTQEIAVSEPSISDLVKVIATHESEISKQKKRLTEMEDSNKALKLELEFLKGNFTVQQTDSLRQELDSLKANLSTQQTELLKQDFDSLRANFSLQQAEYKLLRDHLEIITANISRQTSDLTARVMGIKSQNIQTGFDVCKEQFILFPVPYASKPKILTTFIRLGFTFAVNAPDEPYIFQVNAENVSEIGFNVTCINAGRSAIADFVWLAMDA